MIDTSLRNSWWERFVEKDAAERAFALQRRESPAGYQILEVFDNVVGFQH